jgi:hypothetical protein
MAVAIELKYFNTFWLKKIASITSAVDVVNDAPIKPTFNNLALPENIPESFMYMASDGRATTYNITGSITKDWLIEESRIRGGYNNDTVDFGVKAYLVEDEIAQSNKLSSLIHSGIFNSRTGINQTNQFSVAEDITRSLDPANGSIQKLYAEDTNLIIFQENKVSKSLIDKDAIYSAEGNASVTSRNLVIGQNVAFAGEYGISKDPESFAVNGYRKYFTDRDQNVVCRLSMDGISIISNFGMTDFFRDKLATAKTKGIVGGWDAHNKQYVLSIDSTLRSEDSEDSYSTLSFDETVKGWTSLFDYNPTQIASVNNNYYTTNKGKIYKHYESLLLIEVIFTELLTIQM